MRAIVTLVFNIRKISPDKMSGVDILGRMSSDIESRHKSVLVENISSLSDAAIKAVAWAEKQSGCADVRVSRIELIDNACSGDVC